MDILRVLGISVAVAVGGAVISAVALHFLLQPLEHWRQRRIARVPDPMGGTPRPA